MQLSRDVGEPLVKAFESCLSPVKGRPGWFTAYRCPAGVVTIGWGTTNENGHSFRMNDVWSQKQCDDAFTEDAVSFAAHTAKMLGNTPVTQAQFDALTSWSYNCGGPAGAAVWTYARKGDVEGTCQRLMQWTHGGGRELPGLVRRRKAECQLYRGQIDEALKTAQTHRASGASMTRQVTPTSPPASEVIKRAAPEIAVVATGAGASTTAATMQPPPPKVAPQVRYDLVTAGVGIVLLLVGAAFLVTKFKAVAKDWA